MKSLRTLLPSLLPAVLLLFTASARGAEWRVAPIRIDLDRGAKSGAVTVYNGPGGKMQAQISASEWSQDEEGADRYVETNDLVFFPRILPFEAGQERVIRVGIRTPAVKQERAYRLFIEEMPSLADSRLGTAVSVAVRFGVPVFVHPLKEEPQGAVESVSVDNGAIRVRVANRGNVHFKVEGLTVRGVGAKGEETFRKTVPGWYLLAGAKRTHSVAIPPEGLAASGRVEVEVRTDRMPLSASIEVAPGAAAP
jgi:fimbrial chaperone protein